MTGSKQAKAMQAAEATMRTHATSALPWSRHCAIAWRQVTAEFIGGNLWLAFLPFFFGLVFGWDSGFLHEGIGKFLAVLWGFVVGLSPTLFLWEPGRLRALGFGRADMYRNMVLVAVPVGVLGAVLLAVVFPGVDSEVLATVVLGVFGATYVLSLVLRTRSIRKNSEVTDATLAKRLKAQQREEEQRGEGAGAGADGDAGRRSDTRSLNAVFFTDPARQRWDGRSAGAVVVATPMRVSGNWLGLSMLVVTSVALPVWYFVDGQDVLSVWIIWPLMLVGVAVSFLGGSTLGETHRDWLAVSGARREWLRRAIPSQFRWLTYGIVAYLVSSAELAILMAVSPQSSGSFTAWQWNQWALGLVGTIATMVMLLSAAWWVFIIAARLDGVWLWGGAIAGCLVFSLFVSAPMIVLDSAHRHLSMIVAVEVVSALLLAVLTAGLVAWQARQIDLGCGVGQALGLSSDS